MEQRLAFDGEISTRTPHAGSDAILQLQLRDVPISTRTPHAGSDRAIRSLTPVQDRFQPALPMRGVTRMEQRLAFDGEISTRTPHAGSDLGERVLRTLGVISTRTPHAGSDGRCPDTRATWTYFNPHSPCGE